MPQSVGLQFLFLGLQTFLRAKAVQESRNKDGEKKEINGRTGKRFGQEQSELYFSLGLEGVSRFFEDRKPVRN